MKPINKLFSIASILTIILAVFSTAPASSSTGVEKVRIMIEYKTGQKGPVLQVVAKAGAEVHYEFDELDTLVVTIPTVALQGIERNPNVIFVEEDPLRYMVQDIPPRKVSLKRSLTLHPRISSSPVARLFPMGSIWSRHARSGIKIWMVRSILVHQPAQVNSSV